MTQLASRGFVVFALDHPFESAVTMLPDGQVVGTQEALRPGEPDRLAYMARQQAIRSADVRFVIDQLTNTAALAPALASERLAASRVAVVGHSFGGAAAMAVSSEDGRVVAAVNIDGTPYADLPDRRLNRPVLLLQPRFPVRALLRRSSGVSGPVLVIFRPLRREWLRPLAPQSVKNCLKTDPAAIPSPNGKSGFKLIAQTPSTASALSMAIESCWGARQHPHSASS